MLNKLLVLFLTIVLNSENTPVLAQNVNSDSVLVVPEIFLENEQFVWRHFPAYSERNKKIILIHSDFSCCLSTNTELQIISAKNGRPIKKTLLVPNENLPAYTLDQKEKVIFDAKTMLKNYDYSSMIAIDSFKVQTDTLTGKICIKWIHTKTAQRSAEFVFPKMAARAYCCTGLPNDKTLCEVSPNAIRIWLASNKRLLLIQYGFVHQANGCDIGPYYKTVFITD